VGSGGGDWDGGGRFGGGGISEIVGSGGSV